MLRVDPEAVGERTEPSQTLDARDPFEVLGDRDHPGGARRKDVSVLRAWVEREEAVNGQGRGSGTDPAEIAELAGSSTGP